MALIKKTIILTDKKTVGYASVIRVGSETGVKIVGETFDSGMEAVLRIGKATYRFSIAGKRTETSLSAEVNADDEIGCLILRGEETVAFGGAPVPTGSVQERSAPISEEKPSPDKPQEKTEDKEILDRLTKERRDYYFTVRNKVDELFVVHPAEEKLSALIPDSEWVKVRYDGEDYYVVGRLRDESGKVVYLGYGVPGVKDVRPPKVADGIATFLPEQEGSDKGYWLFFQNADNGKIE